MSSPKRKWLQNQKDVLVNQFLLDSGAAECRPREFLAYIEARPEHPLHDMFFGRPDSYWAGVAREDAMRRWLSGSRVITTSVTRVDGAVRTITASIPAVVSFREERRTGGGYLQTTGSGTEMAELAGQAADSLDAWLKRTTGLAELLDVDLAPAIDVAAALRAHDK